ncbi:MAG: pseudouridine-5'-phosphate glycosidase [Anaerolineaceae bacterium]|jgi:pseudouridine-5'-phosphate glycosidase
MEKTYSPLYQLDPEVEEALNHQKAVVALESTVITHGLPFPQNLQLARQMEAEVRAAGAVPATVAVLGGKVKVGLSAGELDEIGDLRIPARKVSRRDYGIALARGEKGGTTVAGTLIAAAAVGIKVFATGGIGGVHRNAPFDISADLPELSRSPVVVVCAGAKSILDLPATVEYLETMGIPTIGYQTSDFPAFYSRHSGLPVTTRSDHPADVAMIAHKHWQFGLSSAVLVVVPPPAESALDQSEIEAVIQQALRDAAAQNIHGAAATPFLLSRVSELSGGASLQANLALLLNNARIAGQVAAAYQQVLTG